MKQTMQNSKEHKFSYDTRMMYRNYPFKKYTPPNKTIVYIKKRDTVEHEHSLSYEEYKKILDTFTEKVRDRLLEGRKVTFPHLGSLQILKTRSKGRDKDSWRNGRCLQTLKNDHSDGFKFQLTWKVKKMKHRNLYKTRAASKLARKIMDHAHNDAFMANRFNNKR